ncbi:MAG: hypothetical protein AAFR87_21320 [Bacteroidota bacterium]
MTIIMDNNHYIELGKNIRNSLHFLSILSKKENILFHKWLKSQSGKVSSEELKAYYALNDPKRPPDPDEALKEYFGDKHMSKTYLRAIHSRLAKKIKEFLSIQTLSKHPLKDVFLLQKINRENNPLLFDHIYKQVDRRLQKQTQRSSGYYQKKFLIESELQKHLLIHYPKSPDVPFEQAVSSFDHWWIHQKLVLACYARSQAKIRPTQTDSVLLGPLLNLLHASPEFNNLPVIRTYLCLYDYLGSNDPDLFKNLLDLLNKYIQHFDREEQHNFFTIIYNHYAERYQENRTLANAKLILAHYEWGIQEKILYQGEHISWDYYRILLNLCMTHNLLHRAEEYLNEMQDKLSKADRKELIPYFQGLIHFNKGNWGKAKAFLNRKFAHPILNVPARIIHLQAVYSEKEWIRKGFLRKLHSLEQLVSQHKHPGISQRKTNYLLRITYFRALVKCQQVEHYRNLLEDLNQANSFPGKAWLLEKIQAGIVQKD